MEKNRLSSLLFILFFLSIIVHKSNYLISLYIGLDLQSVLPFSLLVFPIIFLIGSYYFSSDKIIVFTSKKSTVFVRVTLLYLLFMFINALINENKFMNIVWEVYIAAIIYFSYKLAASDKIWKLFEFEMLIIFGFTAIMVFAGTFHLAKHLYNQEFTYKIQSLTTSTLAYEISPILDFWPFVFLINYKSKNFWKKFLSYLVVGIYILFQLFFLKRAPTGRAIMVFTCATILFVYSRKSIISYLKYGLVFFILSGVLIINFPKKLVERFKNDDNSRPMEFQSMIGSFSSMDYVFGRGLGGAYVSENWIKDYYDFKTHKPMRIILHIGIAYALLKGGIILWSIIFIHVFRDIIFGLTNLKFLGNNQFASLIFLIVYCAFRFIEGPPSTGAIFDSVLFGMSLGSLDFFIGKMMVEKSTFNHLIGVK